ncbi:hypothetical protein AAHC03_022891 [Spirometra sp. Aus1]
MIGGLPPRTAFTACPSKWARGRFVLELETIPHTALPYPPLKPPYDSPLWLVSRDSTTLHLRHGDEEMDFGVRLTNNTALETLECVR